MRNFQHTTNFHVMPLSHPLSVTEASQQVNVPKRTIQYAISQGDLQAHKMPGRTGAYLIDPADLAAWVDGRSKAAS